MMIVIARFTFALVCLIALIAPLGYVDYAYPVNIEESWGKIAPWVIEQTARGAQAEFLVVLADQANLRSSQTLATKQEKGRHVRDALWNKAQATQPALLNWLKLHGVEHRSFYIVNAVWVRGGRALALALAARPDVARIEGNPEIHNFKIPDSRFQIPNFEFKVLKVESPSAVEPGVAYVHAPEVWAMGFTGQGITIGGQDTGYDWNHPALKAQYRGWDGTAANHDYNWHDSIHSGGGNCGADSPQPCDDYGHGTHTMGTAAGSDGGSNQIGIAPGAQWIGCRNMNVGIGTPATYLECFEFFLAPYPVNGAPAQGDPDKAPDMTVNSWTCPTSEGCSWSTLQAAVEAQRAAGIMTVVSAGNDGFAGCSSVQNPPAIYAAAYTVGALQTGTDSIASFSSRGPVTIDGSHRLKPDIVAPGTSICSSVPGGGYSCNYSGTSMAGPHVAGAVALLWSASPTLTNQITPTEQILNNSAFHISSTVCSSSGWPNNTYGYGRLDIKAAFDAACLTPLTGIDFTWMPPSVLAGQAVTFTAIVSGGVYPLAHEWDWGGGSPITGSLAVAHTFASTGTYTVTLRVRDACGAEVTAQRAVEVKTPHLLYLPLVWWE